MTRPLRYIISTVAIIVLLLAIGVTLLITMVNPNDFKPQISHAVQQYTGQKLTIHGKIHWSLFPWLGFKVNQIELANAPGYGKQPLAQVGEADINIRLLPLLGGDIELGKVSLKNTTINLIKSKSGITNWQALTQQGKQQKTTSNAAEKATTGGQRQISISRITISNANVNWTDQQTGQKIKIAHLNLTSDSIEPHQPFTANLDFQLECNQPAVKLSSTMSGKFTLQPKKDEYHADHFHAKLTLQQSPMFPKPVTTTLRIQQANYYGKKHKIDVNKLSIVNNNLKIHGNLIGQKLNSTPIFTGRFIASPFNLRQLMKNLGYHLQTKTQQGYNKVAAKFQLNASPQYIKLNNFNVTLDQSTMTGNINYAELGDKSLDFNLAIDQINLNHYAIQSINTASRQTTTQRPKQKKAVSAQPKPTSHNAIPNVVINGSLKVGKMTVGKTNLRNVHAQLSGTTQFLKINPLTANVYGGSMKANIGIDQRQRTPRYQINAHLSKIQMQQLSKHNPVAGPATIDANVSTAGATEKSRLKNLNGSIRFKAANGIIKHINLQQQLQNVYSFINTGKKSSRASGNTPFSVLSASAKIHNGLVNNKDLKLISSNLQVTGHGTADLVSEKLNYYVKAVASGSLRDPHGNPMLKIANVPIPIKITGTFTKPIVTPDFGAIASVFIQQQLQKGIKLPVKGGEEVGKTIQKGLDAIFGK